MTNDRTEADKEQRRDKTPGKDSGSKKSIRAESPDFGPSKLGPAMESLDRVYAQEAAPPSLGELQARLIAASVEQRRRTRKEWLLFSLISLFLVSFSLLAVTSAPPLYWTIQGLVPIGGIAAAMVRLRRQRHGGGHE